MAIIRRTGSQGEQLPAFRGGLVDPFSIMRDPLRLMRELMGGSDPFRAWRSRTPATSAGTATERGPSRLDSGVVYMSRVAFFGATTSSLPP